MTDRSVLAVFCHDGRHEIEYVPVLTDAVLSDLLDRSGLAGLALPDSTARPVCEVCGQTVDVLTYPRA